MKTFSVNLVYFLIGVFLIISGCRHGYQFTQELPDLKNGRSETLVDVQIRADSLHLPRIEKGFDSLQIRIWLSYNRKDTIQAITIKNEAHKWSGYLSEGAFALNEDPDSLHVVHFLSRTGSPLQPTLDWQQVIDTLVGQKILTLPDCRKIMPIDEFPMDGGNSVTVEISTKKYYRVYTYVVPGDLKQKYHEAGNICNILNFLSNQFHIKYLGDF